MAYIGDIHCGDFTVSSRTGSYYMMNPVIIRDYSGLVDKLSSLGVFPTWEMAVEGEGYLMDFASLEDVTTYLLVKDGFQ
jgi:hypothetical protein